MYSIQPPPQYMYIPHYPQPPLPQQQRQIYIPPQEIQYQQQQVSQNMYQIHGLLQVQANDLSMEMIKYASNILALANNTIDLTKKGNLLQIVINIKDMTIMLTEQPVHIMYVKNKMNELVKILVQENRNEKYLNVTF
jgi:hypothetical protein